MKQYHCKHCGQPMDTFIQESGPYTRDDAGQIVAGTRKEYVQCINIACDAWMCTASVERYDDTTDTYVAYKRAERKAKAHA